MYLKRELDAIDLAQVAHTLQQYPGPKLGVGPVCDFCGDAVPKFQYAAKRMSTGEWRDCWRWLACLECSELVDAEKWDEVKLRIKASLVAVYGVTAPDRLIDKAVEESFKQLRYAKKVE